MVRKGCPCSLLFSEFFSEFFMNFSLNFSVTFLSSLSDFSVFPTGFCTTKLVEKELNTSGSSFRWGFHKTQGMAGRRQVVTCFITSSSKQLPFPSHEENSSRCVLHMTDHSTRRQARRCMVHGTWLVQPASKHTSWCNSHDWFKLTSSSNYS